MDSVLKKKDNLLLKELKYFIHLEKEQDFSPFLQKNRDGQKLISQRKKLLVLLSMQFTVCLFVRDLFRMVDLSGTAIKITFNPHTFP
jgi:hypothetical protein